MENITYGSSRSGGISCVPEVCYARGAVKKVTKATASLAEDEKKYYYQLHLAPTPEGGPVVYAFCDQAHAELVAKALKDAKGPVQVDAVLSISQGAVNVTDVAV